MGKSRKLFLITICFVFALMFSVCVFTANLENIDGNVAYADGENYLTLTAIEDGSTVTFSWSTATNPVEYTTDGTTWNTYTKGTQLTLATAGDYVKFRSNNTNFKTSYSYHFEMTGKINGSGSVTSLIDNSGNDATLALTNTNCLQYLFSYCTSLVTAPDIVCQRIGTGACMFMFQGCTSLTTAPDMSSVTEIDGYGCQDMFYGCTSLKTTANMSSVTKVGNYGCNNMYGYCSNLTTATSLPATTLAANAYDFMFQYCSSLVTAPDLPATDLSSCANCYNQMFIGCSSLVTAPTISATKVGEQSCYSMFSNCSLLTTVPDLSFTEIGKLGCANMFYYCSALVNAPAMNSLTTVGESGCINMYQNCNKLTTVPDLKATTVGASGYQKMFLNCTSLVTAPKIEATTINNSSYREMFGGCTSLTTAPDLPIADLSAYYSCYLGMFSGCSSLVNAPTVSATKIGSECLESMFASCSALKNVPDFQFTEIGSQGCCYMFSYCTSLENAPAMNSLTTVGDSGCITMYEGCSKLTTVPDLKATTVGASGYQKMFLNCTSLETAPKIEATTINNSSYREMFGGCTSLTTAPDLPITDLSAYYNCYLGMFSGCRALVTAPTVSATKVGPECFESMFASCSALTTVPDFQFTEIGSQGCRYMFSYCTSLVNAPAMDLVTTVGYCGCIEMYEGCSSLIVAPDLKATTVGESGYTNMFYGCSSLQMAPSIYATTLGKNACYYMFKNCTKLNIQATQDEVHTNAWTIQQQVAEPDSTWNTNMFSGCTNVSITVSADTTQSYTYYQSGRLYEIVYDANGATSGSVPADSNLYLVTSSVTLKTNTGSLAKTSYIFAGWALTNDATTPLSSYSVASADATDYVITLYAVWAEAHEHGGITYDKSLNEAYNDAVLEELSYVVLNGNYYLTNNLDVSKQITINGNTNLCLNGYVLKFVSSGDNDYYINCSYGFTLNIYDCNDTNVRYFTDSVDDDGIYETYSDTTSEGAIKVTGGVITGCSSACCIKSGCTLTIENVNFVGNKVTNGGVIYIDNRTATIKNCNFYGNIGSVGPTDKCSVITSFQNAGAVLVENCDIAYNLNGCATIGAFNSNMTIKGCTITNNTLGYGGYAAVFSSENKNITIINTTITNNTSSHLTGGLAVWSTVTFEGKIVIKDNTGKTEGGRVNNFGLIYYQPTSNTPNNVTINSLSEGSEIYIGFWNDYDACLQSGAFASSVSTDAYAKYFKTESELFEIRTSESSGTYTYSIVQKYTITFNLNGGTGTAPASITDFGETEITLPNKGDIAKGKLNFLGWGLDPGDETLVTAAGGTYTITSDATLYAIWQTFKFTKQPTRNDMSAEVSYEDGTTYQWYKKVQKDNVNLTNVGIAHGTDYIGKYVTTATSGYWETEFNGDESIFAINSYIFDDCTKLILTILKDSTAYFSASSNTLYLPSLSLATYKIRAFNGTDWVDITAVSGEANDKGTCDANGVWTPELYNNYYFIIYTNASYSLYEITYLEDSSTDLTQQTSSVVLEMPYIEGVTTKNVMVQITIDGYVFEPISGATNASYNTEVVGRYVLEATLDDEIIYSDAVVIPFEFTTQPSVDNNYTVETSNEADSYIWCKAEDGKVELTDEGLTAYYDYYCGSYDSVNGYWTIGNDGSGTKRLVINQSVLAGLGSVQIVYVKGTTYVSEGAEGFYLYSLSQNARYTIQAYVDETWITLTSENVPAAYIEEGKYENGYWYGNGVNYSNATYYEIYLNTSAYPYFKVIYEDDTVLDEYTFTNNFDYYFTSYSVASNDVRIKLLYNDLVYTEIAGATGKQYTPTTAGTYACKATLNGETIISNSIVLTFEFSKQPTKENNYTVDTTFEADSYKWYSASEGQVELTDEGLDYDDDYYFGSYDSTNGYWTLGYDYNYDIQRLWINQSVLANLGKVKLVYVKGTTFVNEGDQGFCLYSPSNVKITIQGYSSGSWVTLTSENLATEYITSGKYENGYWYGSEIENYGSTYYQINFNITTYSYFKVIYEEDTVINEGTFTSELDYYVEYFSVAPNDVRIKFLYSDLVYTEIAGATGKQYTPTELGTYVCKATLDGETISSDPVVVKFEFTKQPTKDNNYTVETNFEADSYKWYTVETGDVQITDEGLTYGTEYYIGTYDKTNGYWKLNLSGSDYCLFIGNTVFAPYDTVKVVFKAGTVLGSSYCNVMALDGKSHVKVEGYTGTEWVVLNNTNTCLDEGDIIYLGEYNEGGYWTLEYDESECAYFLVINDPTYEYFRITYLTDLYQANRNFASSGINMQNTYNGLVEMDIRVTFLVEGTTYEEVIGATGKQFTPTDPTATYVCKATLNGETIISNQFGAIFEIVTQPTKDNDYIFELTMEAESYQWYLNDVAINGKNTNKLGEVTEAGNYYCIATLGTKQLQSNTLKATKVLFDLNGLEGTAPTSICGIVGETINLPKGLVREGYSFAGWNKDYSAKTGSYTFTLENSNVGLYAIWSDKAVIEFNDKQYSYAYDGQAKEYTVDCTTEGTFKFNILYKVNNEWVATAPINVGSYDVKLTRDADTTYAAVEYVISSGLTITKANNTITLQDVANVECGKAPVINATATFGTVTYTYSTSKDGEYTSIVPTAVGTYYVKASVVGTDNYNAADAVKSFVINHKYTISYTWADNNKHVTAKAVCACGNEVTETAVVIIKATSTEVTYYAIFKNELFTGQTKTEGVTNEIDKKASEEGQKVQGKGELEIGELDSTTEIVIKDNDLGENKTIVEENVKSLVSSTAKVIASFDVNILKDGSPLEKIEGNKYKITVAIPSGYEDLNTFTLASVASDGTITQIQATVNGNYLSFITEDSITSWVLIGDETIADVNGSNDNGLSDDTIADIVIGSVLGAGVLAFLIYWFIILLKKRRKDDEEDANRA